MLYFCLSGSQHSTYYPGGIWAQRKGDVDGANEHSKMAQCPLIEQIDPWGHREFCSPSIHPEKYTAEWEVFAAVHPTPRSSDIQLLSLTVTLSRQQTKPWIMTLLYKRTGKNNQARFVLSFRLSWEIDFYLKDPTWTGRLDFSHRSQITLSTEKSHYFCPKERQSFSKVL